MDADTRKTLADALRGATVEQLREDAKMVAEYAEELPWEESTPMWRRLATLALAVATMQERAMKDAVVSGWNAAEVRWQVDSDGDTHWFDGHMYGEEPRPLPAALAALVEDA